MYGLTTIASIFLTPIGAGLLLLALALVLMALRRLRTAGVLVLVAFVGLYAAAMPALSNRLAASLEQQYPPTPVAKLPAVDVIILLGGGVAPALPPRLAPELNEHADRMMLAADLYKAGKAPFIIASGGSGLFPTSGHTEAGEMQQVLARFGVPETAVVLEQGSADTADNARLSKALLTEHGWTTALLVTSALHMPRALAAFRRAGIAAIPATTDIIDAPSPDWPGLAFLPKSIALTHTGEALHEWAGLAYYRLRGWI